MYPPPYLPTAWSLGHLCNNLLVDSLRLYFTLWSQLCEASVHLTSIFDKLQTSGKLHSADSGSNERRKWHSGVGHRQRGWHQCFRQCMLQNLYRPCVAWHRSESTCLHAPLSDQYFRVAFYLTNVLYRLKPFHDFLIQYLYILTSNFYLFWHVRVDILHLCVLHGTVILAHWRCFWTEVQILILPTW